MTPLYTEQQWHSTFLLNALKKHRGALDNSITGSGKTYCAVEVAKKLELPTLIVCPLAVIPTWERVCKEQGLKPLAILNYEKLRNKKNIFCRKIGNQWCWNLDTETLVVWDEAARLKSYNSIINKIAVAAKPCYNLLLSATIAESAVHMRAAGYLLGLHKLRDYWQWARDHGCTPNQWGALVFNGDKKMLHKIHEEIVPDRGHGLTVDDMKTHYPDTQTIFESVDYGDEGEIADLYTKMGDELEILESAAKHDSKGAEALTLQLRARQRTEILKIPLLVDRAQELLDEGRQVVVFLNFNQSIDAFKKSFPDAGEIRGDQKPQDRRKVVDDFQKDTLPLVVANMESGGVGISLHGKKPRATLITLSWNGPSVLQALGRVHRAGGSFSQQWILSSRGSIEEQIERSIKEKIENMTIINQGLPCPNPKT